MTQFTSPALYQPQLPHSILLMRGTLAALAIVLTAGSWIGVGAQAARPDPADQVARIELPPVVIKGQRELIDGAALALVAARPGIDCGTPSASPMPAAANGASLAQ